MKKAIAIATVPFDAKITSDGKELKSPVVLQLAANEAETITVACTGYLTQNITVMGTDDNRTITLVPQGSGGGHPTGTATTKPTGNGTSSRHGPRPRSVRRRPEEEVATATSRTSCR